MNLDLGSWACMEGKAILGRLFIVVGIGLLVAAGVTGVSKRAFIRGAASADGVVARLNAGGSHPQIEFTSPSGLKIAYPQGGFIFGYRPGNRVRVLYSPNDPANTACLDAFGALWFVPLMLGGIGLLFVIGGVMRYLEAG